MAPATKYTTTPMPLWKRALIASLLLCTAAADTESASPLAMEPAPAPGGGAYGGYGDPPTGDPIAPPPTGDPVAPPPSAGDSPAPPATASAKRAASSLVSAVGAAIVISAPTLAAFGA